MSDMVDYRRTRTAALERLAAAGDVAAAAELGRRGLSAPPRVDVTTLDDATLRARVQAWNDGVKPEERRANRELAARALAELEVRFRVDHRRWARRERREPPLEPPVAPWLVPRPARVVSWLRPQGSSCYPLEASRTRAALAALEREVWKERRGEAAGVPQKE